MFKESVHSFWNMSGFVPRQRPYSSFPVGAIGKLGRDSMSGVIGKGVIALN